MLEILIVYGRTRESSADARTDVTSSMFNNIIQDLHFQDAGLMVDTRDKFTYYADSGQSKSRLDYILVSDGAKVTKCDHMRMNFSDHRMVKAEISVSDFFSFGKGVWRLNVSLLQDEKVQKDFKDLFAYCVTRQF